ncbi:hypothetical protein [Rhizocola hellebori]|uniref:hypothetical protein n=1 Tax=Rhizocola hellebori TaxID=1392758 RepID=UPI0019447623|nr:hypothetical protein [Rhizocola hellebori]
MVARLHRAHGDASTTRNIGMVACAQCWEQAIRADERLAVEFELPALDIDPDYVDTVAVERACKSDTSAVRLTPAERRTAVAKLTAQGLTLNQICRRLRIASRDVRSIQGGGRSGQSLRLAIRHSKAVAR